MDLANIPGVLRVFSFDSDSCSYTMEAGERTLADFMGEPLSDEIKIAILRQVLSTMSEIH